MKHQALAPAAFLFLLFAFCPAHLLLANGEAGVNFYTGSLKKVQEKAAKEGKLYFIDFVAAWCMPCRQMDETTFKDPALAAYLEGSYIASKIDVDDFDGLMYKNQYNIKVLPTILVFNASGKLLGRYEEALTAPKMLGILKNYDTPANRQKAVPETPASGTGSISRPPLKPEVPAAQSGATATPKPAAPAQPSGSGLFRFDVSKQPSQGFSVQIGVYGDYENVLRESARFKDVFKETVLVHIDRLNDKTVYRLMIGEFKSQKEAETFLPKIKELALDGFVKDLAMLK